jgi:predicted acyl esterase
VTVIGGWASSSLVERSDSNNQGRRDVLVYTGPALGEDLELTGPVTVKLYASTSAVDTDFIVCLSDVRPDGYVQNLVEGLVRGRFRAS